jgi:arabinofuranosyltransferase
MIGWLATLAALAALMALTRPDGLLFLAATAGLIGVRAWGAWRRGALGPGHFAALAPFGLTAAHMLWRRLTYGGWLPNTYAAKYTGPWPESGIRYVLSFVIEYALWLWLALAAAFVVGLALKARRWREWAAAWRADPLRPDTVRVLTVVTLAAHFGYYTFMIGGDHFEYRVYSHLVPLLLVSSVWLLNALRARPAWALGILAATVALAQPIPWTHWALSQQYTTRLETWAMRLPVAPHFPAVVRPYVAFFDSLQAWLIERAVGVRHQEHKIFIAYQLSTLPPREVGLLLSDEAEAVRIEGAVGAIGWVLPTVAIIDAHGLTDYVIAHHPLDPNAPRLMAHDRIAPEGYLECYRANAFAPINKVIVAQRGTALEQRARQCETADWPLTPYRTDVPDANLVITPEAARVIDNVWLAEPVFVAYVPPEVTPVQSAGELWRAFGQDFHDTGCVVFPAEGAIYGYAFLPPNLRYAPEELRAMFPWAAMVDFGRTGGPRPYALAYALPGAALAPAPTTVHVVEWGPASLLGYDVAGGGETAPGELLEVRLYFRANQPASTEQWFKLSLEGGDDANGTWTWDEGDPCRGLYPAPLWEPGQVIVAKAMLALPEEIPAGEYRLRVSMFDLAVGADAPLEARGETVLGRVRVVGR